MELTEEPHSNLIVSADRQRVTGLQLLDYLHYYHIILSYLYTDT
jgi:hypothetical protein